MNIERPRGWAEIPVKKDGALVAVITRPCAGADWFVHFAGWKKRERFRTRKAALARAEAVAP